MGGSVSVPDENRVTHPAEINARDKQAVQLDSTTFTQIGTGDNPGMNRASKSIGTKPSPLKFSNFKG
jgi:hypothetical protein